MRWLGELLMLWTPGFLKARACREMSAAFTARAVAGLEAAGPAAVEAFRAAAFESGREAGARLKSDLRLGDSFEDALLAWRLVTKLSGMKARVTTTGAKSVFEHTVCPVFAAGGSPTCRSFCVPFVEGLTAAVCPSCRVELMREPAGGQLCAKALIRGG